MDPKNDEFDELGIIDEMDFKLEDTYDDWLQMAERVFQQFLLAGIHVVKVDVDVDELALWCYSQGLQVDDEGRSKYAAYLAEKLYGQ